MWGIELADPELVTAALGEASSFTSKFPSKPIRGTALPGDCASVAIGAARKLTPIVQRNLRRFIIGVLHHL